MRYFPIFLDLEGREVLVAGGGEQAAQKLRLLLKTKARLVAVAEAFAPEIIALGAAGVVRLELRAFRADDVAGKALVYAATGDAEVSAAVAAAARAQRVPVNVVDDPEHCTFITPAIVDRDPVVVAIGTEGAAPVLAREIKSKLEAILPQRFGKLAEAAPRLRERIAHEIADPAARRRFWERLLAGPFRHATLEGDHAAAARAVEVELTGSAAPLEGRIVLIGCGPGDADLLTLKAQQRLQEADVLVVDRLVSEDVLELARRDAERIYVGKTPGGPSAGQDEINRILIREAAKGKIVARLKGGDSFIFGRAAEEMAVAHAAGITVEVIPGITAAHACAARIGLPLTLRQRIRQFSVLTGATTDGDVEHDWAALAAPDAAFAIYMGVASAPFFRNRLLKAGAEPATPVVIVENGTLQTERAVATTLFDLDACISAEEVRGPCIIFVGLDWERAGLARPAAVKEFRAHRPAEEARWTASRIAAATHWVMG